MRILVGVMLVVALSACSVGTSSEDAAESSGPSLGAESTSPEPPTPTEADAEDTCVEVRAGIDACARVRGRSVRRRSRGRRSEMPTWSRSLIVDASAQDVWRLLIDTDQWPRWGPSVTQARVDGGTVIGPAARGAVRTPVGLWINFDISEWRKDADELRWSWRVAGVPATSHWVRPLGPDSCRVGMDVPLWAPAYLAIIEVALRRIRALAQ